MQKRLNQCFNHQNIFPKLQTYRQMQSREKALLASLPIGLVMILNIGTSQNSSHPLLSAEYTWAYYAYSIFVNGLLISMILNF